MPYRRITHSSYLVNTRPLSQQIPIIRTQIPLFRLLILRQPQIPRRLVPHPVLPKDTRRIQDAARRGQTDERDTDTVPGVEEVELVAREEGVGGYDPPDIAKPNLPRRAHRAAVVPAEVHGEPADYDRHGRVHAHGDEEERRVLETGVVVHGDEDAETGDGEADWQERERETVLKFVAEVGDDHGEGEGGRPRRDRVELRADRGIAVGLDDAGGEEGVPVRRHDEPKVHEPAHENLVVSEDIDDVLDADGPLSSGATLILAEAILDVGALVVGEPLCVFGEIGDDEVEGDCDHGGQEALEDKYPPPAPVAAHVFHLPDRGCEKATKCPGEGGATEEERVPSLGLAALVPHPNQVKGSRKPK